MKFKIKEKIAFNIAKDFWDNTDDFMLKYRILKGYVTYLNSIGLGFTYIVEYTDYDKLSQMTWKEMALCNCPVPSSELRKSISYYLGIGLYEGYKTEELRPMDIQYQREYKLKTMLYENR